ncbi:hypothetical protein CU097_003453, partial [Rhizopus azygosporus]
QRKEDHQKVNYTSYIDALEKRIRKIEERLHNPVIRPETPAVKTKENASINQSTYIPFNSKQSLRTSADKVVYLGDLSSLQFFSNKIPLNDKQTWTGQRIRKFGNELVLIGDTKEEDDQQKWYQKLSLPQLQTIHYWIYSVTGIDRHTSDRLIKIYFANIHPVLPVVNKAKFLEQYRDQSDTYPPADLLNAMLGAAARFVECDSLNRNPRSPDSIWDVSVGWSDQFFEQAERIITQCNPHPTISKVQAIILIHNHRGSMDSKSSACWMLGGIGVRMAQCLGLNKDCEEWDIPESEKQTRKRIWWSLYIADRFHSASLGRPLSIRDEDNDVGYPDPTASWKEVLDIPDESERDTFMRFPSATCNPRQVEGRVGIYQLFVELIKLSEILGRILQGLYTPKAKKLGLEQASDSIVKQLDEELTQWRFGFPVALKRAAFEDFDEKRGYLAPVTASVLLCYFSLLILLHRPFIEAKPSGHKKARSTYSSFSIGTSAATRGIRIASQMTIRDFLMFPYSFSLYPVLQCCLILMYNTKNPDARISAPAKADLVKGINMISRVRVVSSTAKRLYNLLKTIMGQQKIELSDSEDSNRSFQEFNTNNSTISSHASDGHAQSQMETVTNGVQRQPSYSPRTMPTIASPYPGQYGLVLSDMMAPPSVDVGSPAGLSPTSSMPEAFSLKQFGFQKSLPDYDMQNISEMPIINQNIYNPFQQFNPPSMSISIQQQPISAYASPGGIATKIHDNNEGIFRNKPNNPFFGIPASMDWTEWNEWSQSTQGNTEWQFQA